MLKPQWNKTVGTRGRNWGDNIKMYFAKRILYGCKTCVHGDGASRSLLACFSIYSRTTFLLLLLLLSTALQLLVQSFGLPNHFLPIFLSPGQGSSNLALLTSVYRCGYVDWIGLAQDREMWRTLVSEVMNLRVPWNSGNYLTSCKPVRFARKTLHHAVSK